MPNQPEHRNPSPRRSSSWPVLIMRLLALLCLVWWAAPAAAVQPDEVLKDPALEERARDLSSELRCVVCQNQSIDESNAPLARDLRLLVRERLVAGDSDGEILDYIVARYGEFVLLRPPIGAHTIVLWLAPAMFLLFGAWLARELWRRNRVSREAAAPAPLSAEDQARLDAILNERGDGPAR